MVEKLHLAHKSKQHHKLQTLALEVQALAGGFLCRCCSALLNLFREHSIPAVNASALYYLSSKAELIASKGSTSAIPHPQQQKHAASTWPGPALKTAPLLQDTQNHSCTPHHLLATSHIQGYF